MDLEDPSRMDYEIVVPVKPLPPSDKPLKGLLKRNKCESNSSTSSSSTEDGKSKKRVKFAETMMVFCDDWPEEVMPQIIQLKSPTDFNLIEIVASGFMFDPPVEYQDLLPFDPPPDYQDCVSSNKHPSIIPMSSYEKDSSISYIDDDDQCESNEFSNDYHNQINSSLHWENILNESEILEEDIIGVLKEDEILQAIGSQTADIDTVFHPMESEENYNENDFPVHYQNGQYIQQDQGRSQNGGSNSRSSSEEGLHISYCDRANQATETSEAFSDAEELSSDLASDSSFTSQDTIILTTPLANDPNSLCHSDFHPSTSSADSILSPGKTVVAYVDQYSTEYTQIDVSLDFEPKLNKPVLETINDEEEEVRSDADIGSISEDRSSLNEPVLEDANKVKNDNYRSKGSHETSVKDDCTASIEGDDGDDDIVSEADNSLNQGEGSNNNDDGIDTVIKKEEKENNLNTESKQFVVNSGNYSGNMHEETNAEDNGSNKLNNNNNNEPVQQLNEISEGINSLPLISQTGPPKECLDDSGGSVSRVAPFTAASSSPISSSAIGTTAGVPSNTFVPTQSATVVNTCGSNVVVIGVVDCDGINKSDHNSQHLLATVPVTGTSVSVSAIRKAFEVKYEPEVPLYENTTEMRNKAKNTSQPAPARPKSFPFANFKLGKSVDGNKNSSNAVNSTSTANSSSTTSINNNNTNGGNNSSQTGSGSSSGSSLIKEATNVMTEKLKWLTLHGGDSSKQQSSNDELAKTAQQSLTTINDNNKSKQSQQLQQPQRSKEDLIIEYTSEPRGAQQVKRVPLTEVALKTAACNATKGVIALQGAPLSAQIVNHYHHVHHPGPAISTHQIVQSQHPAKLSQPLTIPVSHLQCFPPGTAMSSPIPMDKSQIPHQIVHSQPVSAGQHHGTITQQIQIKSVASVVPTSSTQKFIIPSAPQQQPQQSPNQPHSQQYHIYPVTKCRAASPQFINQYCTNTSPGGQRQLVYVSHVAPGQQYLTSQTIHHHPHLYPQQQSQSQTSGQTIQGQPTQTQPGIVTMVSGAPHGSRETPSIIQLHCRPASSLTNQQIIGSRIYAQPLPHGFVALPKDSSFPNPSEIRRRDGLNAYPIVKEDPSKMSNTSSSGSSPTASSLSSASSSSSVSPSSSSSSTVPNSTSNVCNSSSDSTNLSSSDTKDELEQFVENDLQRIERIKRRYSLTEEGDDPTFGFGRRPSVRGIKPKYGANEIIRHMQMQLRPPMPSVAASQTLPKQAKVINTQIVNESPNLVSSASSHGLTSSLSTTTITTATPVILTSGSVGSQSASSSSSQVPRTAQIHLITRHSHSHCHPHLISASQVGSVPNLRQHLVASSASISPSSSSSSSPSPSGYNTIGHRHVYLIPHVQGGPQYQRIVQAAGATLPRQHPGQQQGQSQHKSSAGLTQQLSAQQAMLMMKQMGGRVKIINGSQSNGSIGIVGNPPPLSRPASSLGHIIQRGSNGDAELRLAPQSSTLSSSDVTYKQCPVRTPGPPESQPCQSQAITVIGNKAGPCLLQHKTISMPNVSLIKSLPQSLTVVPFEALNDERGTPEGASSSPTHSTDAAFVEINKTSKSFDVVTSDTMSTGSTSSCSSSTSSGNTGTSSSYNVVDNNLNATKNNEANNSSSNNANPNNANNIDNDDITMKHNNNPNNLTNSNNNINTNNNTNNNINNNLNNNPDLVKDATTSALKAKKNISSALKDGKAKPVTTKDGVIYYSMNV